MITRRTASKVTFKWGDACLAFSPVDDRLLDELTITTKELAFDPRTYQKKVVYKSETMLLDKENTEQARKAMGMPDKDIDVDAISANQIQAICRDTGLKTYRDGIACIGAMMGTNTEDEVSPALERKLYVSMQRHCGEVIYTYQGFLVKLVRACVKHGIAFDVEDCRVAREGRDLPQPKLDAMTGFRFSQKELVEKALSSGKSGLIGAPTRYGKCLGIDTKVLTASYDIVKIQDVKVGDCLMGPDGTARTVTALGHGKEQSYRIIPSKGEPFICNESHILPLKVTGGAKLGGWKKGDLVFVTVKEYLGKSKTFKHVTKLWYAALDFQEAQLPVDPWIVGVWLGDGCFDGKAKLTKPDTDVQHGLITWAEANGYTWEYRPDNGKERQAVKINTMDKTAKGRYCSAFRQVSDMCCLDGEKRIPKQYLTSSRKQRLELLAGLIDTDGTVNNDVGYEIVTKYDGLAEDIIRLCRGLGFRVTRTKKVAAIKKLDFSGVYWRLQISGDLPQVPCRGHKKIDSVKLRVDPAITGFTVEDVGIQDYYGVTVDGPDKMFLLWDHLVTHNTILMINVARAFPDVPIAVIAPGVDLCNQLYGDFTGPFGIKDREVKLICSGSRNTATSETGITICSADSVGKIDSGIPRVVLADEPHALVTATRVSAINKAFPLARRYGFGATLTGRFDGADPLIEGLFGPVLAERTYKEAVEEGAICPLAVIFFDVYLREGFSNRDTAYKKLLFESPQMAALTARLCNEVIPQEFQTMLFVKTERQAEVYRNAIGRDTTIAMAKRMNKAEREEVTSLMRNNVIKRCLCTDIYVQGVTFSDVRVLINCEAGGNNTTAIQKPGRLAQVRDGKKCGIVFDFCFKDAYASRRGLDKAEALVRDSAARKKAYTDKGYEIKHVTTIQEAIDTFNDLVENGRFTK